MRFAAVLAVFAGVLGLAVIAQAEPPTPRHIIQLPVMEIPGRPQGPGATYVVARSRTRYRAPELREHFVREVPRAVRSAPF